MATKGRDDMPVLSRYFPTPPGDSSFWPEIQSEEIPNTPWTQAIKDLLKFLDVEEPQSVKADEDGIQEADFLIANADISVAINDMKKKLIDESGVDEVEVTYFKNWPGTLRGLVLYARPTTIRDVKKLVKACGELGIKVGCGGSYHSWGPLYPDASTKDQFWLLISNRDIKLAFERGNDDRRIDYDEDKLEVRISAGVTTGELLKLFLEKNVCFKTNVIAQNFTYGGVLATGSHGTGRDQPLMSDWITSIKVVGPEGKVRTFPNDFDDVKLPKGVTVDDAMNALRLNLGVFGVVVEITLKVEPMVSSEVRNSYPQIGDLFYGPDPSIKHILKDNWSVQILWLPFNSLDLAGGIVQGLPFTNVWQPKADEVWLRTVNLVETSHETNRWEQLQKKFQDTLQNMIAGELGSPLIARYPFLVPAYLSQGFNVIKGANPTEPKLEQLPYAIHFLYGLKYTTAYDMEFAFPVDIDKPDGFDVLLKAVHIAVEAVADAAKPGFLTTKDFPLTSALDIRLIKKSDCLLCPAAAHTSTHTAYIEVVSFLGTENYKAFFKKIGKQWMDLGGAPHWAKQWSFLEDEGIYQHLREYYGENMKKFTEVLEAINGTEKDIFINKSMKKLLFE